MARQPSDASSDPHHTDGLPVRVIDTAPGPRAADTAGKPTARTSPRT